MLQWAKTIVFVHELSGDKTSKNRVLRNKNESSADMYRSRAKIAYLQEQQRAVKNPRDNRAST